MSCYDCNLFIIKKVHAGTFDLIILILIFIGLQAWWLIPIIKRNNQGKSLTDKIKQLERIYKKNKWKVPKICLSLITDQNLEEKILFSLNNSDFFI